VTDGILSLIDNAIQDARRPLLGKSYDALLWELVDGAARGSGRRVRDAVEAQARRSEC
jgi:hypothetical protein